MKERKKPTVKLVDLTYQTAGGTTLINSINLEVYCGEILTIAGPNGSGKTTLLKLISGLLEPTKGAVYHSSLDVKNLPPHERAKKVALISQIEQPDSRLKVQEYINLGTIPLERNISVKEKKGLVKEAVQLLGLNDLLEKTMAMLSGGEQQRVFIARSICQRPDILLLDEPTNHLDPKAKGEVLSAVSGLGITVIAVLHELSLASHFSDKILMLKDSEAIAVGPPDKTLTPEVVRKIFGVDVFHFQHPVKNKEIVYLDIPLSKNNYFKESA